MGIGNFSGEGAWRRYSLTTYGVLAGMTIGVDQLTKYWALELCFKTIHVTQWFSCELAFNRGVSWGFLHSHNPIVSASVVALSIMLTGLLIWYAAEQWRKKCTIMGETLVIAGAIANLIDRLMRGAVVDFIALSWRGYSWPTFNIADCAIVIGIGIMLWGEWCVSKKPLPQ